MTKKKIYLMQLLLGLVMTAIDFILWIPYGLNIFVTTLL